MKITIEQLQEKNACADALSLYYHNDLDQIDWSEIKEIEIFDLESLKNLQWLVENFKLSLKISSCGVFYIYKKGLKTYFGNPTSYWEKFKYNSKGNLTYYENSKDFWEKKKYNSKGNLTYYENSKDFWKKHRYNSKGQQTYFENSYNYWRKSKYNSKGLQTYYEDSTGQKIDYKTQKINYKIKK